MRKTLVALALVVASITAPAQTFIPFAGGNLSWMQVIGMGNSSRSLPGFTAGMLIQLRSSSLFSVHTGLQYTQTGGKIVTSLPGYTPPSEVTHRIYAIQLPVILSLKMFENNNAHFFAGAGFYMGANLPGSYYASKKEFGLIANGGYRFGNGLEICGSYQIGRASQLGLAARYALKTGTRSQQGSVNK